MRRLPAEFCEYPGVQEETLGNLSPAMDQARGQARCLQLRIQPAKARYQRLT